MPAESNVSLDREVRDDARALEAPLVEERVDGPGLNAQSHLVGVPAASERRRVQQILERHAARLEPDRVEIRQVVADDGEGRRVRAES